MKLEKGKKYNVAALECSGWNSDETDGYNYVDYFSVAGEYLGPDKDGVEPEFEDETVEEI